MKDNDIIKALEWLEEIKGFCSSEEKYIYATTLVDLINRQQAEIKNQNRTIEMLDSSIKCYKHKIAEIENELDDLNCKLDMYDCISEQQENIKQLDEDRNAYQNLYCQMVEDLETAKSEAYEEFAERLKLSIVTRLSEQIQEQNPHLYLINTIITDLVKEMVGEDNA